MDTERQVRSKFAWRTESKRLVDGRSYRQRQV